MTEDLVEYLVQICERESVEHVYVKLSGNANQMEDSLSAGNQLESTIGTMEKPKSASKELLEPLVPFGRANKKHADKMVFDSDFMYDVTGKGMILCEGEKCTVRIWYYAQKRFD